MLSESCCAGSRSCDESGGRFAKDGEHGVIAESFHRPLEVDLSHVEAKQSPRHGEHGRYAESSPRIMSANISNAASSPRNMESHDMRLPPVIESILLTLERRISSCESMNKGLQVSLEKRMSSCESMNKSLQAGLLANVDGFDALRNQMQQLFSEKGKGDGQNFIALGETFRQELAQLRNHVEKEMATFEIRLAVNEETLKSPNEVVPDGGATKGNEELSDVYKRLQLLENANGLQRRDDITEILRSKQESCELDDDRESKTPAWTGLDAEKKVPPDDETSHDPKGVLSTLNQGQCNSEVVLVHDLDQAPTHHAKWQRDAENYVFEESVWDLALFAGLPCVGTAGSYWIIFILIINICMQVALCLIIHDAFTIPTIDENVVESVRLWRLDAAHDFKWMDALVHRTLGKRICDGDSIPPLSYSIASLLGMIDGYQTENSPRETNPIFGKWFFLTNDVGVFMTCLAVMLWWLDVLKEMTDTLDLAMALSALPIGGTTDIHETDDGLALVRISHCRHFSVCLVVALRIFVAVLLLFTGTCYLVFTIELSDLLLNAAALAIVFDVDEMMYTSLSPRLAKQLICEILPLDRPRAKSWAGLDYRPPLMLVVLVSSLVFVVTFHLHPQNEQLKNARHEICGGNIRFVSIVDAYGAVLATNVPEYSVKVSDTYRYKAMLELVQNEAAATQRMSTAKTKLSWSATALAVHGASYSIKAQNRLPIGVNIQYWVTDCSDMPSEDECASEQSCWRLLVLRADAGDKAIRSCADVVEFCGVDATVGIRARQYCPHTCGCNDPSFSNLFFFPNQGCATSCIDTNLYYSTMSSRECIDDALNSSGFTQYLKGIEKAMASYHGSSWVEIARPVGDAIAAHGCSPKIRSIDGGGYILDMCARFNILNWKSLSFLCPVTCGCPTQINALCPLKCSGIQQALYG